MSDLSYAELLDQLRRQELINASLAQELARTSQSLYNVSEVLAGLINDHRNGNALMVNGKLDLLVKTCVPGGLH